MSGGVAYVWDPEYRLSAQANLGSVEIEPVEDGEALRARVERHRVLTGSRRAADLLDRWPEAVGQFVTVMPVEYRRAMRALEAAA
jgi:glutamate synthase (NADPH/NADH) large chain